MHALRFALLALALPMSLGAQGTLSSQGFGYPPGQVSTRVLATGGALAEFDPITPLNPAALSTWGRSGIYVQYSPEFRSLSGTEGGDESSTLIRFPVVAAALAIGSRATVGIGFSTLLDRTWRTAVRDSVMLPDDTISYVASFGSVGAINDVRLGVAYNVNSAITVGIGAHAFTGENRQEVSVTFDSASFSDSSVALPFEETGALSYSGNAISGGFEVRIKDLALAASGRTGGRVRAYQGDTLLQSSSAPSRLGGGIRYTGIAGTTIAVRANWDEWSRFGALLRDGSSVRAFDGWDVGIGAEVKGPGLLGQDLPVRAGFRRRTLPFSVTGDRVRETNLALGFGIPMSRFRAAADVALQRSMRRVDGDARENAWTFSIGIAVKP
ncbi:MAG TPA: hypothetical protein VJ812_15995 [Gemmatimonadaceae bacterium]|nr:hypothetical protein [Gemmatimonadaceae bacterium]